MNSLATIPRQHEQPQCGGEIVLLPVCINLREKSMKADFPLGGN
jgi:hypothetical protein